MMQAEQEQRLKRQHFKALSNLRFWLTPGMGVKRHVGLALLGTLVLVSGVIGFMLWLLGGNRQALSMPIESMLVSSPWQRLGGWISLALLLIGLGVATMAIGRLNRSLLSHWLAQPTDAAELLHRRLSLAKGPRIVALGGGTGLANLLRGLRKYSSNTTAIVTVSDDGGSSGRLRDAFGMPAPGDLNDCLAALSDDESKVSRLLEYRFERGGELQGHTFGNLMITTLTEVEGDLGAAVRALNTLLNITGAVYPATAEAVTLNVQKASGECVSGESKVRTVNGAIQTVSIEPDHPSTLPEVPLMLETANLIVLGPGSLFTSTIPPLLVPDIRQALLLSDAPLVYICNIMTEAGETDGFSAWDHVERLHAHLGRYPDWVVVNTTAVDEARLARYREERAELVSWDAAAFEQVGIRLVGLELLSSGLHAQHDSVRLARWLVKAARRTLTPQPLES